MPVRCVVGLWAAALLVPSAASRISNQEAAPASQPQSSSSSNRGAQLRMRRTSEKTFRWEDRTNSRGEFAIRVPQGTQYEMVVHVKNFTDQARTIDARTGSGENNVVFRMERTKRGKQ